MSQPTAAIILAAGKGTRMKSDLPKVMHAIGGFPMIGHVIYRALEAKLSPISVVVGPGMESVGRLAASMAEGARVAVQKEQLGTAHAVLAAKESLKDFTGNLIILYGDTPLIRSETIARMMAALEGKNCGVAVLGFTPHDAADYGRLVLDKKGRLDRIVEAKDATAAEKKITLCNSGVIALAGAHAWKLLEQIGNQNAKGEYYLTDVVALARKAGLDAAVVEGDAEEVLGVNSRAELALADMIAQQRACHYHMSNGVTLLEPGSVYFSADTRVGSDTIIEPNVFFGPGVTVGRGVHIKAFSHIEGATIGDHTSVGPFARLRPGTQIGEDARIGNFVEIKKSDIADGAKISHLSYVGDATVGAGANIGAGTITCNYDGYNKYQTIIGRDVFVGSNSALVAPVTIGDGAIIAAGSVVTENVAADSLALARSRQSEKPDWAKDFRDKQKK